MLGYFRLMAATGVLMAHVSNFVSDGSSRALVSAFFIVSGYLISLTLLSDPYYRGHPFAFYWNRFLRLYPVYWLVAAATAACGAPWFFQRLGTLSTQGQWGLWLQVLTLQLGEAGMLVAPAWTLPYEIGFYLLAPAMVRLQWRSVPVGPLLLLAAGVGMLAAAGETRAVLQPFGMVASRPMSAVGGSFVLFAVGSLAYHLRVSVSDRTRVFLQWLALGLLASIVVTGSRYLAPDGSLHDAQRGHWMTVAAYVSTVLMLVTWSKKESGASRLAGDLTYPVYLVHWPLLNSSFFGSDVVREISGRVAKFVPLGDLVSVALLAFGVSVALGYALVRIEKRWIAPFRAGPAALPDASAGTSAVAARVS